MDDIRVDRKETVFNPDAAKSSPGRKPGPRPRADIPSAAKAEDAENVDISSFFKTLKQMVNEYFSTFPQLRGLGGENSLQKALFTVEGSYRASVSARFEEEKASAAKDEKVKSYTSQTVSVEAKVDVAMKAYKEVGRDAEKVDEEFKGFFTPEKTSGRIAGFAAGFYTGFAKRHPEMGARESAAAFKTLSTNAVDKGFSDAAKVLGSLPDDVNAALKSTHEMALQKIGSLV